MNKKELNTKTEIEKNNMIFAKKLLKINDVKLNDLENMLEGEKKLLNWLLKQSSLANIIINNKTYEAINYPLEYKIVINNEIKITKYLIDRMKIKIEKLKKKGQK